MLSVYVSNMCSPNGSEVANQFEISTADGVYFQSYNSVIAFKPNKRGEKIKLDERYWDYSNTTGKYRNIFLNETKKETEAKIKSGVYELVNLNRVDHFKAKEAKIKKQVEKIVSDDKSESLDELFSELKQLVSEIDSKEG